jgi:hypothetical protein
VRHQLRIPLSHHKKLLDSVFNVLPVFIPMENSDMHKTLKACVVDFSKSGTPIIITKNWFFICRHC